MARYGRASNAATGSEVDPNANVENKNIATLETEIYKRDAIAINRLGMYRKLQEMYGTDTAEEYLRQLEEHEIYRHDETGILGKPYTYGAKEAVIVKTPFGVKLVSLEDMYDMCSEPAVVVDTKNRVAQKYPIDWYVLDRNGYTKVTAITKKERHRDLVSVKTHLNP